MITEQNIGNETTAAEVPYIKRTIGGRTYTVLIHFKENAEETAKDIYGVYSTLNGIIKNIDVATTDNVVFKLFEMADVSTSSNNLDDLNSLMEKSYAYTSTDVNYFYGVDIVCGKNLFEIDYEIYTSDNPEKTKDEFLHYFKVNNPQDKLAQSEFETFLRNDTSRNNRVEAFKSAIAN